MCHTSYPVRSRKTWFIFKNQLGTIRRIQGAKEQALINIAINKEHKNNLKTSWIDVKKAFDTVDHDYLLHCIAILICLDEFNLFLWTTFQKEIWR